MYRMARKVGGAVGDGPLEEVWFAFDRLKPWSERLVGQSLRSVDTLGKALLLRFSDDTTVYTHNQLYGRWMFTKPVGDPIPTGSCGWRFRPMRARRCSTALRKSR